MKGLDRNRRVTAVPYQQPGVPDSAGLTVAQCAAAAWAVAPDGRRFRGAAAINASLAVALGIGLPLLVYALPGVGWLQDLAYAFVARHRGRLPGDTPYCKQHPGRCG